MLRTVTVLGLAAVLAAAPAGVEAQAPSAQEAVEAYYAALAAADYPAVAALTHPLGIARIRAELLAQAGPGPALPTQLRQRLGVTGVRELQAMPDATLYARLLAGYFPDRAAVVTAMAGVVVEVTGVTVFNEAVQVTHVVGFPRPGGAEVRTAALTVARDGEGWKVMPEAAAGRAISHTLGLPTVLLPFVPGGY
jgi:hypothetical protein